MIWTNIAQNWVLLSLLLQFYPSGFILQVSQYPSWQGLGTCFLWRKVFPLDINFLPSYTIFRSNTTLWQFYIKFLPPAFVFSFPGLFLPITNVLPSNKLYVHNLLFLLFFLIYYIFSKNYHFIIKVYYFIFKRIHLYSFYDKFQVEIIVCSLYCHFHSI